MQALRKAAPRAAAVFYLLIALEVIIMLTPFTVYFYSLYAPILDAAYAFPPTRWLTGFFLPHIAVSSDPFLTTLGFLGPALFFLGLLVFLVCAGQVYYAKLWKKGVVTGGLYSYIRHPQYLALAIAGLGLLLFWPRFIILAMYITMLFLYYVLARHEEEEMERKFPEAYRDYASRVSMFLPGHLGAKIFSWVPVPARKSGWALLTLYFVVLAGASGLGFALREYTKSQVPILYREDVAVISLAPADRGKLERLIATALADERVWRRLAQQGTLVAYMMPADYMMQHLIVESGDDHEKHHGGGDAGLVASFRHIADMFVLLPQRQLWAAEEGKTQRVIFSKAVPPDGGRVSPQEALGIGVKRLPFFLVDVDPQRGRVALFRETVPQHQWGTVPMPIF